MSLRTMCAGTLMLSSFSTRSIGFPAVILPSKGISMRVDNSSSLASSTGDHTGRRFLGRSRLILFIIILIFCAFSNN